ncbi:hypothetical protein HY642_01135, partial [Candidatus Woesearchaeota archaeon]|nr:hypothetical protein [Candidatus Woesearchaeota archaeon]
AKIHQGTKGLEMEFMEGLPPKEVYTGDTFQLALKLNNLGAQTIEGGVFTLGTDAYVRVEESQARTFDIVGKDVNAATGGQMTVTFNAIAKGLEAERETHTTLVSFNACYPYATYATGSVCVDSDVFNTRTNKPCKVSSVSMGGGQGAPVSVTKITPRMVLHEDKSRIVPTFEIEISNAGKGQVVTPDKVADACTGAALGAENLNTMRAVVKMVDQELDCQPKAAPESREKAALVKLERKQDTIRCSLKEGIPKTKGTFLTPLTITLEYGYFDTITKQVLLRRPVYR